MLWNFCLSHSYWQNFSLNGSLSVPGQKEKEKDGAQHNFPYSTGQGELWNAPLCRKRDIISSKIKKWGGVEKSPIFLPTNTKTSWDVAYSDKNRWILHSCLHPLENFLCFTSSIQRDFGYCYSPPWALSPLLRRPLMNAIGRPRSDNSPFSNPGCVFWRYTFCQLRLIVLQHRK